MNDAPRGTPRLTGAQRAACARILYALERPGGMAILCGPAGTGVSTVLREVAGRFDGTGGVRIARSVVTAMGLAVPPGLTALLVDDAHSADVAMLRDLVEAAGGAGIVLAGQGRLLTLVSRVPALGIRVRAVLHPLTPAETVAIAHAGSPNVCWTPESLRVLHEIAGGIPAAVVRLVELTAVLAAAEPERPIAAADIEAVHERLTTWAA